MKNRKYQFSRVGLAYVNSEGFARLEIHLLSNGYRFSFFYTEDGRFEYIATDAILKLPNYIISEIKEKVKDKIQKDGLTYYEYNQEGEKRFKNLRYTDPKGIEKSFLINSANAVLN